MAASFQTTFQPHFLEWKCLNFDYNFTDKVPINNKLELELENDLLV